MKEILSITVAVLMFMGTGTSYAQSSKNQAKEPQELSNTSKKELNGKASKAAVKQAKKLTKEGWKVVPEALPLDKQFDRCYTMQLQYGSDGSPLYIMAEAMSIGDNYDAAKMQALELAKQYLAGQIQTEVTTLIENAVANEQMGQGDAASITRSIMANKNLISQSIGRVIPVVETYQVVNGNNRQVLVRIAYSRNMAKSATKKAIRGDLEKRGDRFLGELDELLGW